MLVCDLILTFPNPSSQMVVCVFALTFPTLPSQLSVWCVACGTTLPPHFLPHPAKQMADVCDSVLTCHGLLHLFCGCYIGPCWVGRSQQLCSGSFQLHLYVVQWQLATTYFHVITLHTHSYTSLHVITLHTQTYIPLHVITLHTQTYTPLHIIKLHTQTYTPLCVIALYTQTYIILHTQTFTPTCNHTTHRLMHLSILSHYTHMDLHTSTCHHTTHPNLQSTLKHFIHRATVPYKILSIIHICFPPLICIQSTTRYGYFQTFENNHSWTDIKPAGATNPICFMQTTFQQSQLPIR